MNGFIWMDAMQSNFYNIFIQTTFWIEFAFSCTHTHTHQFLFELKYTFETVDQFDLRLLISVDLLLIDFEIHKNCIETILIEKKKTLALINLDIDFMSVYHNLQLLKADFDYVRVNQFHKLYKLFSSNTYEHLFLALTIDLLNISIFFLIIKPCAKNIDRVAIDSNK